MPKSQMSWQVKAKICLLSEPKIIYKFNYAKVWAEIEFDLTFFLFSFVLFQRKLQFALGRLDFG